MRSAKTFLAGFAAISLALAPSFASANEAGASRLALSNAVATNGQPLRVGTPVRKSEKGMGSTLLIGLVLTGVAIGAAVGLSGSSSSPASP